MKLFEHSLCYLCILCNFVCRVLTRSTLQHSVCAELFLAWLQYSAIRLKPQHSVCAEFSLVRLYYSAVRSKLQHSVCAEFSQARLYTLQSGRSSSTLRAQSSHSPAVILCSQAKTPALCVYRVIPRWLYYSAVRLKLQHSVFAEFSLARL